VVCQKEQVKQVLTRIRRPPTNGMVERFNRGVNAAIAQRGKITDNSGKNTFHSRPEGNTYIINFVDAYNRTTLQCLNYRAPCSVLFDNHPEGNTKAGIQLKKLSTRHSQASVWVYGTGKSIDY
jgi:transposase InsO family protein